MCAFCGFAEEVFELGEDLLDRVQVRTVGRQEEHVRTGAADCPADGLALVAAEIVEDDYITRHEGGGQDLLDISCEGLAIDRTVEDARRVDPVGTQGGDEGQRSPMPMRRPAWQALAAQAPAPERGPVGLHPGLINEDEPAGGNPPLMPSPACPPARDLRALRLAGQHGFF